MILILFILYICTITNNHYFFKDKRMFVDNLVGDYDNGMLTT